jgi:phage baseplate assembly protein gpV
MISRTWSRKSIAFCLAVAVLSVYSMVVLATPGQMGQTGPSGELSVTGQVKVNGQSAISGATVFSDSTIETAQNSSAVISLGKNGRVELLPGSTMKLSFTDAGLMGTLDAGRVRVSTPAGVSASVMTKDGSAMADSKQANVFTVDTECGNTIVATQAGNVELRAGDKTTQIAAGSQDTAGQAAPGTRCTRLRTEGMRGIGGGALAALLLAAGGAVAAAILAGRSENNDLNFGGTVTVVSPTK